MLTATRGRAPGQWWPTVAIDAVTLKVTAKSANFVCPNCAQVMGLFHHAISEAGVVQPSTICPAPVVVCVNARCGVFHEHLVLEGWGK